MSEDTVKAELLGVRSDVAQLRQEGKERTEVLHEIRSGQKVLEVRVNNLETRTDEHKAKLDHLEKRVYQLGCAILLVLGAVKGGSELIQLIS